MKVTVCQLSNGPEYFAGEWEHLVRHAGREGTDLVLLPEMPFFAWFAAARPFDAGVWRAAVRSHDEWLRRLGELAPAIVVGSRPIGMDVRRNQGFLWQDGSGYRGVHDKCYLPDEEGFWEASWYERGEGGFEPAAAGPARLGFLICTEIWFMHQARAYGQAGAHLLVTPRATPAGSLQRWQTAGRAAAIIAGAYSLSANRATDSDPGTDGQSWVIGPEGDVLAQTTAAEPVVTVSLDLQTAVDAKATYPRYVQEI